MADRTFRVFLGALAACVLALAANAWFSEVHPTSAWGMGYGIAAALLLLGAAAYGVRRRFQGLASRLGVGRASTWLNLHLWGGVLFLVLVLMHSAFRFPTGWVTQWLWILSLWTVVSGAVGRGLQKWIPRVLASGLATEVLYDRIPELVDEIHSRAEKVAESSDEAIRSFHERSLARDLAAPRRRWIFFFDITGGVQERLGEFDYLRPLLGEADAERLEELESLYRTKLEMDAHYTLQRALRGWLWLHLPTSLALLVLLFLHLYTVLFY